MVQPPPYGQPQYGPPLGGPPPYGGPPGGPPPGWDAYYRPPAPRPGSVPLRPLSMGEILDGSFRVIRRNPRATLGLSAVIAVIQVSVLAVVQIAAYAQLGQTSTSTDGTQIDGGQLVGVFSGLFSAVVLSAIFGAILTGMLTLVITDDVLGRHAVLGELWARVRPRLGTLIGASLLIAVLQVIGLFLLLVPGVWLWGIWAVAIPALMVERTTVRGALRRSRELVRGTFWRVWGIRALGVLIVLTVGGLLSAPFSILGLALSGEGFGELTRTGSSLPVVYVLVSSIGSVLTTTFTAPVRAGIDALLYVDLRMRKEGLDLQLQRAVSAGTGQR